MGRSRDRDRSAGGDSHEGRDKKRHGERSSRRADSDSTSNANKTTQNLSKKRGRSHSRSDSPQNESSTHDRYGDLSPSRARSRSRERRRRKMQAECIRKAGGYRKLADSEGKEPIRLFWDGFQWVAKTGQSVSYQHTALLQHDPATMNSTRKMRRLYFGNLPLHLGLTETQFQDSVWNEMKTRGFCNDPDHNPINCVWFAKDKGNYGFVEFLTVEETERALTMDGMLCMQVPLKVSRPNDYSTANAQQSHRAMALMGQQSAQLLQMQHGVPGVPSVAPIGPHMPNSPHVLGLMAADPNASRVIRYIEMVTQDSVEDVAEYYEILQDVVDGCEQHGAIAASAIITPENKNNLPYNVGDVFLEFRNSLEAGNCLTHMEGRKYEKRPIRMMRFDEKEFDESVRPISQNIGVHK